MAEYDEDISELAWCAVRYAAGRATYVSATVPRAILNLADKIDTRTLIGIRRDLYDLWLGQEQLGMDFDDKSWKEFYERLKTIIENRQ